jgi:hypothetical protein
VNERKTVNFREKTGDKGRYRAGVYQPSVGFGGVVVGEADAGNLKCETVSHFLSEHIGDMSQPEIAQ